MKRVTVFIVVMIFSLMIVSADNVETANSHKSSGDKYLMMKMYEEAIEEYKIAIQFNSNLENELRPKIANAYSLRGIEKSKNKQWKDAETAFKKSIEYNNNQPNTYYNLGIVLENLGKTSDAIEVYKNFLNFPAADPNLVRSVQDRLKVLEKPRVDPTEVTDHYMKGLELMTDNKLTEAKAEFLLVKGEKEKEAKEMIAVIEGLENLVTGTTAPEDPSQNEAAVKNTVMSLGISFQKKDINAIKAIYSKHASNSLGGYDDIINYYHDFWFTLFENLSFTFTSITIVTEGSTAVVDCYVNIHGIYSGPDNSAVNPKFKPGAEYKIEGARQFLMVKENNYWYITN
ncbi:MAG: tetratricopeptide repeat protein [bacterium]|nr:tetratricopeptide repeat protein [bacterium]